MKRKISLLLCLVLIVSALAGCGSKKDELPNTEDRQDLTIAITAEPTSLDYSLANELNTFSIAGNVYEGLVRKEADGSLVPGLAESWTYNDDQTEITFTLREGVKFHNGETMTADDVVFSFQRALESKSTARMTGAIESVEKIDDTHVLMKLKYSYGPIEGCLANVNCAIVSKSAVEADPEGFGRAPVGAGPYQVVEWKSGEKIVMKAFADYHRGEAKIKDLTYMVIADSTSALVALEKGQIDVIANTQTSDKQNITSNANLQYDETIADSFFFLTFNNAEGLFADNVKLRQAIAYAIDKESILLGAMEGIGSVAHSVIPGNCFGAPENPDDYEYNPEMAKQLLAEAGYPDGLTINMPTMSSGYYVKISDILVDQLRQVGITVNQELMERTAYLQDVYTNCQYDMSVLSISALQPDADFITFMRYHSDYIGGGNNFTKVNNPKLDELLEIGRFDSDPAKRTAAYAELCQIIKDDAVLLPLVNPPVGVAGNVKLQGLKAFSDQSIYVYDLSWGA
ncbi:ABC transporter substrate-binding protein [Feifania hominis]|uniref:ABC transporter substrate-binding protein n=1 Tax=Feifania hominis TaxID=2763660 RepID=A0A926DFV0_9FIRM|nr:ABC transporter substrate-binding protein [Feifania hominis]MBC8537024.1 ABC transporter substrate-binding protein [Feifania hominis]